MRLKVEMSNKNKTDMPTQPDRKVIHAGDCSIYSCQICDCGNLLKAARSGSLREVDLLDWAMHIAKMHELINC